MKQKYLVKINVLLLFLALLPALAQGQISRTSYFMHDAPVRMKLNPALTPGRGYFNIPVIGAFNANVSSNSFGTNDIIDLINDDGELYNNAKFMNKLTDDNRLNFSLNTDVLSFGFFQGKNFWSFNAGLRFDIGASIPKNLLDFMNDVDYHGEDYPWEHATFNIGHEELHVNAYTEIGVGFSRALNDRLSVGGKIKALIGLGNLNLNVQRIYVDTNLPEDLLDITIANIADYHAKINVDARMESSFKGMSIKESEDGYINDINFTEFGIGGYGGALDVGAAYRLNDRVTISAALLDLGFISWSESNSITAYAKGNVDYDGKDYQKNYANVERFRTEVNDFIDRLSGDEILNLDMLQMGIDKNEARKTSLNSTLVLAGEYSVLNWLSVGALSTTCYMKTETFSEFTLSANLCPHSGINFALSYSIVHSGLGLAMKLGPLFVGADYLYLGSNSKRADAYLGISIPIGKKKDKLWI